MLVAGIQSTFQTDTPDESILGSLLDKQQNYFEFQRQLGQGVNTVIEKLFRLSVLDIGGFRIQFALYNTAVLSTRSEQQGELAVPMSLVSALSGDAEQCDLAV